MKKLFSILTVFTMLLCGCESNNDSGSTAEQPTTEAYYLNGMVYDIDEASILIDSEPHGKVYVSLGGIDAENISVGDEIEVSYDGSIAESYPAQVHNVYDIEVVKESETELQYVSCLGENGQFSFLMPSDWKYEEAEPFDMLDYGIDVYPLNNREKIRIAYSEDFGVCGTGLTTEDTEINGMPAKMGIYMESPYWEHITFNDSYYYITRISSDSWNTEYMDDVQIILDTIEFI